MQLQATEEPANGKYDRPNFKGVSCYPERDYVPRNFYVGSVTFWARKRGAGWALGWSPGVPGPDCGENCKASDAFPVVVSDGITDKLVTHTEPMLLYDTPSPSKA